MSRLFLSIIAILAVTSSCEMSQERRLEQFPNCISDVDVCYVGNIPKFETKESTSQALVDFCEAFTDEAGSSPAECLEAVRGINMTLYDRAFGATPHEDRWEGPDCNYPLRTLSGQYAHRGFIRLHIKGPAWGDTALYHELTHMMLEELLNMSCPNHSEACGWTSGVESVITQQRLAHVYQWHKDDSGNDAGR